MNFRVEVTATAKRETQDAYEWLARRTVQYSVSWLQGLEAAIEDLRILPTRWPLARESGEFEEVVRQMLYGKRPHIYRVLFVVRRSVVYVLHVRHAARRSLRRDEIILPEE